MLNDNELVAPPTGVGNLADLRSTLPSAMSAANLRRTAAEVRRSVEPMIDRGRHGHIGGDFSTTDTPTTQFLAATESSPRRSN